MSLEEEMLRSRQLYDQLGSPDTGHMATYTTADGLRLWTRSGQQLTLDIALCTPTIIVNVLSYAGLGSVELLRAILADCSRLSVERSARPEDTTRPSFTHS